MAEEKKDAGNIAIDRSSSSTDVEPGQVLAGREDYGWNRGLSARAVIMLSLGGGIGTGLWVGTGTALKAAGPAGMAIAYCLVALAIYIEFMSIGEMTCYKPVHGGYIRQTMEYVDKAAAFAMGMNFWFSWVMIIPAEVVACISVLKYWESTRDFPMAAYITIFLIVAAVPNFFQVKYYGHVEIFMSILKVLAIGGCMCFMFLMASGALPATHGPLVFHYWKSPGAFNNGIKGICKALLQAAFSCTSAGWVAMTAGEMQDPRRTVKKSIQPLFWRMFMFFVVNIWLVGMCVPYNDPDMNKSGTLASPFILAVRDGGSPIFAHILNALVFITVLSCGITSYYVCSRAMTHMADLKIIHPFFGKKDAAGRPWVALISSGLLGGGLTYLNCNSTAVEVYNWFSSLVGVASFCNWALIYLSHIRFRQGLRAQGIDYKTLPFWTPIAPYAQYFGIALVFCFLAAQLYFAIYPFSGTPSSAKNFFSTYITVPLFIIDYFAYKFWFKTKIVPLKEMDFSPAEYFDRVDKEEAEMELENPIPKASLKDKIWELRKAIIG